VEEQPPLKELTGFGLIAGCISALKCLMEGLKVIFLNHFAAHFTE